jgi:hypothetical protein
MKNSLKVKLPGPQAPATACPAPKPGTGPRPPPIRPYSIDAASRHRETRPRQRRLSGSPDAVALRQQTGLDRFRESRILLRRVRGRTPTPSTRVLAVGRNLYAVFTRSPRQFHLPGAECCYGVLAHPNSRYQKWLVSPRGSDWELATIRMVDGRSWGSKPGRWI